MTYGIFSLDSGNALKWFASEDEAFRAVHAILRSEPDAAGSLGVMAFDDNGHPSGSWHGDALMRAAQGTPA